MIPILLKMIRNAILKVYITIRNVTMALGLHRFAFIKKVTAVCVRNLKKDFAIVNGHQMVLDKNDALQLSIEEYEPMTTKIFKEYITAGNTVLDIGANIGYFTLLAGKLVGRGGQVFAFEPDKNNFSILCKNIALNNYKNIIPVEKAVTEQNEKIKLYISGRVGDHRIFDSGDNRKSTEIDAVDLDNYLKDYKNRIDFIKIDIQGSEYGALKGMSNIISSSPNLKIIIEYQTSLLKKAGTEPQLIIDFILGHGFDIYEIEESKLKIRLVDIEGLKNHDHDGNLFCVRN